MRRATGLLLSLPLLVACVPVDAPPSAPVFVPEEGLLSLQRQADGDSFVASDGVEYRVGMVDTPEVGDCFSGEAALATADFLADGFTVEPYSSDPYGRSVARVATAEGDLGVFLARNGFATDRYLEQFRDEHPAYAAELDDAFAAARAEGAGLWSACPAG